MIERNLTEEAAANILAVYLEQAHEQVNKYQMLNDYAAAAPVNEEWPQAIRLVERATRANFVRGLSYWRAEVAELETTFKQLEDLKRLRKTWVPNE